MEIPPICSGPSMTPDCASKQQLPRPPRSIRLSITVSPLGYQIARDEARRRGVNLSRGIDGLLTFNGSLLGGVGSKVRGHLNEISLAVHEMLRKSDAGERVSTEERRQLQRAIDDATRAMR